MLTIMVVDECEHDDKEKPPPTKKLAAVWMISSPSDYQVPGWLEACEYTASQWTKDA